MARIILASILIFFSFKVHADIEEKNYERLSTFSEVLYDISKYYIKETETPTLIMDAIGGLLKNLDPNSTFLTPDLYKEFKKITEGRYCGIGIEVTIQNGELIVVSTFDDGPARRAGIASSDKIIEIDGKSAINITLLDANRLLYGEENSVVRLKLLQKSSNILKEFEIKRKLIKITAVTTKRLKRKIGLIKIKNFQIRTSDDLRKALDNFIEDRITGLILDLRDNPGGILEEAVKISDFFMKSGVIVVVKERSETKEYRANEDANDILVPMVVIVNNGSASATEILASSLLENERSVLIGTKTFGKGTVQQLFKLKDDYGLKLTVAEYLSPKKNTINHKGVCPNIIVSGEKEQIETAQKYLKSPWKVKDASCN